MTITEKTTSRDKLIQAAIQLMVSKGFMATSVDEICQKAEVNRGSFFYYFKSKEELGKELVHSFNAMMVGEVQKTLDGCGEETLRKAYGLVNFAIDLVKTPDMKGCLVGTFSQEISDSHPDLQVLCKESFKQTTDLFEQIFEAAKIEHAPAKKFNARDLAEEFIAILQGSLLMIKASKDRSLIERTLLPFKAHLKDLYET